MFGCVIGLALAIQYWAILQWPANLDSDEAVFGLMALHMMQGRWSVYMYGQHYISVIEPALSAGLMHVFGINVVVFRLSTWLLYGLFLVLHGLLGARVWDKQVALLSLLVLAVPGPLILWWTYRPIAAFGPLLVCGTGALLLTTCSPQRRSFHYARLCMFGVLIGLGLWSHPLMVIYIAAIAGVAWLRMPEWSMLHHRLKGVCDRAIPILPRARAVLTMFGLVGLGMLAFFSEGCAPMDVWGIAERVALVCLFAISAAIAIGLWVVSARRRALLRGAEVVAIGYAFGNLPQWSALLFNGNAAASPVYPSCPTDAVGRTGLVFDKLLPATWGLPPLTSVLLNVSGTSIVWVVVAVVVLAAVVRFAWTERTALWALLTARPLQSTEARGAGLGVVYALPTLLAVMSSNIADVMHVRYLLISWQAASVVVALLLAFIIRRAGRVGLLALALLAVVAGGLHLRDAHNNWSVQRYRPQDTAALEQYLQQHGVHTAYADYWLAYTLDFVTNERLVVAPYNGIERYLPYTQQVKHAPVRAFIFWRDDLPPQLQEGRNLIDVLQQRLVARDQMLRAFREGNNLAAVVPHQVAAGDFAPHAVRNLRNQAVLERRFVNGWDVWLVQDHP